MNSNSKYPLCFTSFFRDLVDVYTDEDDDEELDIYLFHFFPPAVLIGDLSFDVLFLLSGDVNFLSFFFDLLYSLFYSFWGGVRPRVNSEGEVNLFIRLSPMSKLSTWLLFFFKIGRYSSIDLDFLLAAGETLFIFLPALLELSYFFL